MVLAIAGSLITWITKVAKAGLPGSQLVRPRTAKCLLMAGLRQRGRRFALVNGPDVEYTPVQAFVSYWSSRGGGY